MWARGYTGATHSPRPRSAPLPSVKRIVEKTWLAAFVVIAIAFVAYIFRNDRDKILEVLRADVRYLGLAAITHMLCFLVVVVTWQRVLTVTTHKPAAFVEAGAQVLLLNFGKYIPGKVWGVAARGARLNQLGYRLDEISSATVVEQFLMPASGFWLAFLAASLLYGEPIYVLLLLLTTLTIAMFRHAIPAVANTVYRFRKTMPVDGPINVHIRALGVLTLAAGYMATWLFLSLAFIAFVKSLVDIELTLTVAAMLSLCLTAGYLAGLIAVFAPGGVGVREGVGAALLATIMPLDEAILLMLLFRVWAVGWELLAGFAVIALRHTRRGAAAPRGD